MEGMFVKWDCGCIGLHLPRSEDDCIFVPCDITYEYGEEMRSDFAYSHMTPRCKGKDYKILSVEDAESLIRQICGELQHADLVNRKMREIRRTFKTLMEGINA